MKFLTSVVLIGLLRPSEASAANRTTSLREDGLTQRGWLSLEKISRVMRTEASNVHANSEDPVGTWDKLLKAERNRILKRDGSSAATLRRSVLRQDDPVTPFLICDLEYGVSGQERKQMLSDILGADQLMNLYNKDDMSCFALQSTFSTLSDLPENFQSVPILPEMKMPHGTMDAIDNSDINLGRVEAVLCPGVNDLPAALAAVEQLVKEPHNRGRELRLNEFAQSRSQVDHVNHQWHRTMSETSNCDEIASELRVDSFGDTIMFAPSSSSQGGDWHTCLRMFLVDLSLHDNICFVGAYEDPQILNDLASGILQSGSANSKPFYSVGLDGSGQVVALADSGIDIDNCYFYDSKQSTPKSPTGSLTGPVNALARKVIQYVAFADDDDYSSGHGSK